MKESGVWRKGVFRVKESVGYFLDEKVKQSEEFLGGFNILCGEKGRKGLFNFG